MRSIIPSLERYLLVICQLKSNVSPQQAVSWRIIAKYGESVTNILFGRQFQTSLSARTPSRRSLDVGLRLYIRHQRARFGFIIILSGLYFQRANLQILSLNISKGQDVKNPRDS